MLANEFCQMKKILAAAEEKLQKKLEKQQVSSNLRKWYCQDLGH